MKIVFVNLFPETTIARYLLSSYVLKAYLLYRLPPSSMDITVLNFPRKSDPEKICRKVADINPDMVGYSCYVWNMEVILRVVTRLRQTMDCIHVLGGPEICESRLDWLHGQKAGDYFVPGEGEEKLYRLVSGLLESCKNPPPGVAFSSSGRLEYTAADANVELENCPSVYLTGALEDLLYARQQVFMETQRGCRFRCKYCLYHKGLPSIRYFSTERILSEIDHLILDKQVAAIRIVDAIFTSNLERAKTIARHLVDLKNRPGVHFPWIYWEFTPKNVDEEFLQLTGALKQSPKILNHPDTPPKNHPQIYSDMIKGYKVINCVGLQSFNSKSLKAVGRPPLQDASFKRFMDLAAKYNLVLKMDLILGLPFETLDTFFNGLEKLLPYFQNADHIFNIHRLQILPGSELEDLVDSYGLECEHSTDNLVTATPHLSAADIRHASRLSALLFRLVNSPLRGPFFDAWRSEGKGLMVFLESMLADLEGEPSLSHTALSSGEAVDDEYWNDKIFREIPTNSLIELLKARTDQTFQPRGAYHAVG